MKMEVVTLLIYALIAVVFSWVGFRIGTIFKEFEWMRKLPAIRQEAVEKSRSVLTGKFSEQLAPYLPGFPFIPTECKFLGSPLDFIVFKGLDTKEPEEIVFVEVKTGSAVLTPTEKKLKEIIEKKKVRWQEYRPQSSDQNSDK